MKPELQRMIAWSTRTALSLLVLLVGVTIYVGLVRTAPRVQEDDTARTLPRVAVFQPEPTPVRRQWRGYGTARPYRAADVPARVGSLVLRIPEGIRAGTWVARGQTLVQLDPSDFQRQDETARYRIEEIQAQLDALDVEQQRLQRRVEVEHEDVDLAAADLERARQLFERQAETQQQVNMARRDMIVAKRALFATEEALAQIPLRRRASEASLRALDAERRQAEINLSRCMITSPISGFLQSLDVDEGENVSAGQRVARVVDLSRMEVPLRLPVSARRFISIGDELILESTGAIRRTWEATVVRIAPEDDPTARTMTVFAELDQEQAPQQFSTTSGRDLLFPGAFTAGTVSIESDESRWVVPRRAVREGRIQYVDGNILGSRPVQVDFTIQQELPALGLDENQWAVLVDDLSPLRHVLVSASPILRDGQQLDIIDVQVTTTARRDLRREKPKEVPP